MVIFSLAAKAVDILKSIIANNENIVISFFMKNQHQIIQVRGQENYPAATLQILNKPLTQNASVPILDECILEKCYQITIFAK